MSNRQLSCPQRSIRPNQQKKRWFDFGRTAQLQKPPDLNAAMMIMVWFHNGWSVSLSGS